MLDLKNEADDTYNRAIKEGTFSFDSRLTKDLSAPNNLKTLTKNKVVDDYVKKMTRGQVITDQQIDELKEFVSSRMSLTSEELEKLNGNTAPQTPPPTPNAAPATPPDLIEELRNHGLDFDFSDEYKEVLQSSKYAELLAKLKTSKFPFSEKRVEAIKEARQEMEDLRKEQHNILRSKLEKLGVSKKSINGILEMQDITFLTAIYSQITDNELKLTSSDQKNILQESATRFTNWWTRQGGGGDKYLSSSRMVGNVKKAAFMGALAVPAILVGTVAGHETGKALFVGGLAATTRLASNQNQFSASSPAKVRVKGADGTETVKNEIDVKGDDTIIEKVPLAKVQGDYRLEKDIALIRDAYRQASDKVIFKGPAYVVTDVQEKNRSKDVARARNRLKYSLGSFAGGLILSSEFIHHI